MLAQRLAHILELLVVDESQPAGYCDQDCGQPRPLQTELGKLPAHTGTSHKKLVIGRYCDSLILHVSWNVVQHVIASCDSLY